MDWVRELLLLGAVEKDGQVSLEEVRANEITKQVEVPDVDLDGDGSNESFSIAVGFEAVSCQVVP